jgi:Gpi18-like mannosyltransferase
MPLPWGRIAGYFLASRFFIYIIGLLSVHVIVQGDTTRSVKLLDLFKSWDANWYLDIGRDGYLAHGHSTAFFPLYPLLLHLGGFLFHDLRIAGYLVSNAFLLGSCLLLWKLIVRDYGREDVADRAIIFFLFCPVSFFFSTIYTESLFFLLMLALTYLATERRWIAAGCCGYLAALTRPVGLLLVVVLAAEFIRVYRQHRGQSAGGNLSKLRGETLAFLASLFLTGAGLATYGFYLWRTFGNPLDFMKAQAHWNRHLAFPWVPFERFYYLAFYDVWFYAAVVTALVLIIIGLAMRLRASYSALCIAYFLIYLSTSQLEAIPRFLSVLFPFYITISLVALRFPRLEPLLLAGSVMLLTLSTVLYVNGYWFT